MASRLFLAHGRRGLGAAAAATCAAACARRARADDEAPAPKEPPKPPTLYKDGGFDPAAIEAVAELAKQNKSKSDLQYMIAAEKKTQQEHEQKKKEYEAQARQMAAQQRNAVRQETDETRRLQRQMMEQQELYKQRLRAETDQAVAQLDAAMKEADQDLEAAHEARCEKIRQATAALASELREKTDAEYYARRAVEDARAERQNQDLYLENIREKGGLYRDQTLAAVEATFSNLGSGLTYLLEDRERAATIVGVVTAAAAGFFVARKGTSVVGNYVEARLKKPSLVRETSRGYAVASSAVGSSTVGTLVSRFRNLVSPATVDEKALMQGAVFAPALEQELVRVAGNAAGARRNGLPFQHALFHGPPGTGKTLFAKKLAAHAQLDYAIMTGGDVAPLGRDAVTDMHKLFDWAATSPRGLLLLIDEADAFVRRRGKDMSEDARNALNAFLYRTGSPSSDVLVVFASNAPQLFDRAIHDRIDQVVLFDNPEAPERTRILAQEVARVLAPRAARRPWQQPPPTIALAEGVDADAVIADAAERCAGMSARELVKLAIAWESAAFATPDAVLTRELVDECLEMFLAQTARKRKWHEAALAKQRARLEKEGVLRAARRTGKSAPRQSII